MYVHQTVKRNKILYGYDNIKQLPHNATNIPVLMSLI